MYYFCFRVTTSEDNNCNNNAHGSSTELDLSESDAAVCDASMERTLLPHNNNNNAPKSLHRNTAVSQPLMYMYIKLCTSWKNFE